MCIIKVRDLAGTEGTSTSDETKNVQPEPENVSGTGYCTRRLRERFGGVVGYRICLTHRRSPVRARAESFFSVNTTTIDEPGRSG